MGNNHISGTADARVVKICAQGRQNTLKKARPILILGPQWYIWNRWIVKFCKQVYCIKSLLTDDKQPLKGRDQGHMTHFQFQCPQSYLRNGWSDSRQVLYAGRLWHVLALGWQTAPPNGCGQGHVTPFLHCAPNISLVKLGTSNFICWLTYRSTTACVIYYLQNGSVQSHVISLHLGK